MFRRRRRHRPDETGPFISAHPIDLLLSHGCVGLPNEDVAQRMALDFLGGGAVSNTAAVRAIRRAPSQQEQDTIGMTVALVFEEFDFIAATPDDRYRPPPGYAASNVIRHHLSSILLNEELPDDVEHARFAVAGVTGRATASLWEEGRLEDAFAVALTGCCLYARADDWVRAQ